MKKISFVLLCISILFSFFGCGSEPFVISSVKKTDDAVDTQLMEKFLSAGENKDTYASVLGNNPQLLSYVVDITPASLENRCSVYMFSSHAGSFFGNSAYLVLNDEVFLLGVNISEFAYRDWGGEEILYFLYSTGSGFHASHLGAFDFETKQLSVANLTPYAEDRFGVTNFFDFGFCLSEDGARLGICRAKLEFHGEIDKTVTLLDGLLTEDIYTLEFSAE